MLKQDAVPTKFAYNANKEPLKLRASVLREEAATKKKLCDDSFMRNKLGQHFEFKINTKATQTFQSKKQMTSVSTQMELDRTNTGKVRIECNIEHIQCNIKTTWRSQRSVQQNSKGNLSLAGAILFSANAFQKISKHFEIANIQWITKTSYYSIPDKFLARAFDKNYSNMNASIAHRLIIGRLN